MELNRELTRYSSHDSEQKAFTAMQLKGFEVADLLMQEANVTASIQGHHIFVAPFKGQLEVVATCDYSGKPMGDSVNLFFLSEIEGQSADMLDDIREGYEQWLASPSFVRGDSWQHCADALHELELWLIKNEASRSV
ncbi:MAG: hypothetical protein WC749_00865 [Dehalococcoidia bacterium]|uniref:hypothetical protein n=1 Tax=unclassified Pseudomonas TaxID=196821 RepID=UPI001475BECB|nr:MULTISPECIES: hypothetical protein [unclassified Pseudomonas]NMX92510.1 hypothetical protein [Pseudomonas sp. WS 5086]NMY47212.1 hypothetical protein [Pseudomonas sp. WS 5027]